MEFNLNINELVKLEGSDDFDFICNTLSRLKAYNFDTPELFEYIKSFMHYRLFMKPEYICDTYLVVDDDSDDLINVIINKVTQRFLFYISIQYKSINEFDVTNNCIGISSITEMVCKDMGVECETICLDPAYDKKAKLFGGCGYHYFNIVSIGNKKYLVDLSYKQFFKKNMCFLEEIGVPHMCAPTAGKFMLMDEERKRASQEILKNGFIELKGDNLKLYCDGFTLSYRNGLYYEYFGNDFSVAYTCDDYMNFLYGDDSQIKHEPIECLGFMKKYKNNH